MTARTDADGGRTPMLEMESVSKTFPGQKALRDVSLAVGPGEIRGLVGANGSGKSTLIKCLAGYYHPDSGCRIHVAGDALPVPYSAKQAHGFGLVFIHQELGLVGTMTVTENLALGRGFSAGSPLRINWAAEHRRAATLLAEFDHPDIDPRAIVQDLSTGARTMVAIVRGLQDAGDARVLVLDEPTAALSDAETTRLFESLRKIAARGVAVIFISHRLEEILALTDRVTVLREGELVGTFETNALDEARLIEYIVGRALPESAPSAAAARGEADVQLRVERLSGRRVRDVSFSLVAGEIVGVAGLLGSGRSELARLIFGAQTRTEGRIAVGPAQIDPRSPRQAIRAGVVLVPQDRRRDGAMLRLTMRENLELLDLPSYWGGLFRRSGLRALVRSLVVRFRVRPNDPERPFFKFSGGNQQKAIVAKWLHLTPKVIVLDEPEQGVDIESRTEVYERVKEAAALGAAVLIISNEFEELEALCDRILVLREGRLVDELAGERLTDEAMLESVYATKSRLDSALAAGGSAG